MVQMITIPKAHYNALKRQAAEYTVFDAIRDNGGKGIRARDLLKALNGLRRTNG